MIQKPTNDPIPPSDLAEALSTPPFINVPGAFNTRDLAHPPYLRPGLIYRSGSPANLTTEGKSILAKSLDMTTIFDLRSAREKSAMPIPELEEYGIDVVSLTYDTDPAALDITDFIPDPSNPDIWNGGAKGYSKDYMEMLSIYKAAFRTVLDHLLTKPNSPILFNCTAGKDRTGVLAALILSLVGVPDEDIAFDYALTRIGFEPQREFLTSIIKNWKPEWHQDSPEMKQFSAVRGEYVLKFLGDVRAVYSGDATKEGEGRTWAEVYVRKELGYLKEEVETLRANLKSSESS